jgi:ABC-type sugar transport system ATPase subunit
MLLDMRGITKRFGGAYALKGVDLNLREGEVHALLGENGAGKSTLMKILSGVLQPDEGTIAFAGQRAQLSNVAHAQQLGIVMVYQELTLVPHLSIAENLFLGKLPPFMRYAELYRKAERLLAEVELHASPATQVGTLGIGEQQLIEIARALGREGRLLIFDEPTAALSAAESERLFTLIQKLRQRKVTIVYISHRLEEVFRIADRVTVLRDGTLVDTLDIRDTTPAEVVRKMVGRDVRRYQRLSQPRPERLGTFTLESPHLAKTTITLHKGEIIGLAGVVGSGRSHVLSTLYGLQGIARWDDQSIRSPQDAIAKGMFLIPADRKAQGLVLELSVRQNLSLATLERLSRWGFLTSRIEDRQARSWIERLSLRPRDPGKPARELSGGNQQKVVVGKALATEPRVLLMDEPTRGVDVGARAELYDVIEALAADGLGLLLSSSDTEELVGLADRMLVFHHGEVTAELAAPFDDEEVVAHVTGAHQVA